MTPTLAIALTAVFTAVSCALLGAFLVLRKMTMVGDAISHAVLPGIAVAYWLSQSRASLWMFLGAAAVGVLATIIIELLRKKLKVQSDASIGMTFTTLFALGVILITFWSDSVDLDQECVLYGEIAYVPFNTWSFGGLNMGPIALWSSGLLLLAVLAYTFIGFKGLKMSSFNEDYAAVLGIGVAAWNLSLMAMVSFATVVSFESVGAILVVALLVVPAATAYLLVEKLHLLLIGAGSIALLAALGGYALSRWMDTSIAGTVATLLGVQFLIVLLYHQLIQKRNQHAVA
ncbi:MAG: metal ABC transporter permease [Bacteroidetes bacterium]|jgi:manganese/zinc/iron transport system permease protein|nr:metal ABC transporter permease [Bacteroidota bacterium]MBT7658965.1 metal ABC transporter permease [Bacteroidota bacterium]MDG1186636.1 metal ABC transporter permease [Schleiferiaceae bacterium]MDG1527177.1 metal ABC transporter permease [Schleiferiaceae bacterium]NCF54491.1 iron chelate uptake ABC transporter family permease subunit [Bacteroidota bacterium]